MAEAFAAAVPENGPAVGVFASGTVASGLYPRTGEIHIVRVEAVAVDAEKRELQPA